MGTENKDWWDRLSSISTFLSSVVIAGIGLYFTHSYNAIESARKSDLEKQDNANKTYQAQILEMQTVEKFIPHLTSKNEETKKIAILTISTLASSKVATNIGQLYKTKGTQEAVDIIMASSNSGGRAEAPLKAPSQTKQSIVSQERHGWIYLGDFDSIKNRWNTRYLNFDVNLRPGQLNNLTLGVRKETGALNVRAGMPTDTGEFPSVVESLQPNNKNNLHILEVKPWLTTGYMWAKVTYSE